MDMKTFKCTDIQIDKHTHTHTHVAEVGTVLQETTKKSCDEMTSAKRGCHYSYYRLVLERGNTGAGAREVVMLILGTVSFHGASSKWFACFIMFDL